LCRLKPKARFGSFHIIIPASWYSAKAQRVDGCAEAAVSVKHCLKMPLYPSTLQHLPVPMDAPVVLACGKQLESTLKQIHNAGYGHNDVKAANVFISASGEQQLNLIPICFEFCVAVPF